VRALAGADDEYLALCGAVGLGRLLAERDGAAAEELRRLAADGRWRVREGVAMGLQLLSDADMEALLALARSWVSDPSALVRRAAVAGVCEPRLLRDPGAAAGALDLLDAATASLAGRHFPADESRVLRQALGYCWSVAVAALPAEGFARLERLAGSDDPDVRWLLNENLSKARLTRADPERSARLRGRGSR
jgi:hypothetical protein